MADVTGPISTLPGAIHDPKGNCDNHPGRPATHRVQGETDSFGCEMEDLCDECFTAYREEMKTWDTSGKCDWCGQHAEKRRSQRDYEEGMCGPVYQVCQPCINRVNAEAAAEMSLDDGVWDEPDDLDDDEPFDPGEECGRWDNGKLGPYSACTQAGTEFCDWECPHSRADGESEPEGLAQGERDV